MDFHSTCLNGILGNAYECTILKDYFDSKSLTVKDFLQACCAKMTSGEYVCSDYRLTPSTTCCHSCALKGLKDLAYLYRKDIPSNDLPLEVTRRVDCYWGKECRTQFNKPEHAR
jgi:E3 ubiquitin-protein ligase CHFR